MTKYSNFLKAVATNKIKLKYVEFVELTDEGNSMAMQMMPKKL